MKSGSTPRISSFILRFVEEESGELPARPVLRGSIRHIQSDQELAFTRWSDALAFMERFVPVEGLDSGGQSADSNLSPASDASQETPLS